MYSGCSAFVIIKYDNGKQSTGVVEDVNLNHTGHAMTKALHQKYPGNRKLKAETEYWNFTFLEL